MASQRALQRNFQGALDHYGAGRFEQAGALIRKVLKAIPKDPGALHLMGAIHLQAGRDRDQLKKRRREQAKARSPAAPSKARQLPHQQDPVLARRVAHPLDRPQQHPLGAILRGLGADEDADRGSAGGRDPRTDRQHDGVEGGLDLGEVFQVRQGAPRVEC